MDTNDKSAEADVHRKKIEERAYAIWESEGRPAGRDLDYWLCAETEAASAIGTGATASAKEESLAAVVAEAKPTSKKV